MHLSTNKIFGYRTHSLGRNSVSNDVARQRKSHPTIRKALSDCRSIRQLRSRRFPLSCNDGYRALLSVRRHSAFHLKSDTLSSDAHGSFQEVQQQAEWLTWRRKVAVPDERDKPSSLGHVRSIDGCRPHPGGRNLLISVARSSRRLSVGSRLCGDQTALNLARSGSSAIGRNRTPGNGT